MKKIISKIGQNKFQFFFFLGLVSLVMLSIVLATVTVPQDVVGEEQEPEEVVKPDEPIEDTESPVATTEVIQMPLDSSSDYVIVRTFYEKDDTKENQLNSLIKYENSYRTSLGTSYALKSGDYFNVVASITGIVSEVSTSPLFGNYVVITSDDNIKMYYYGLSEIEVTKGNTINQGETIGKSGTTVIDSETGIHVYFQITKDGKYLNPEKVIGLKVTELK